MSNKEKGRREVGSLRIDTAFFDFVENELLPAIDLDHDATRYFDYHHTANDTLDKVEPEALRFNVAAWATFLYFAAETATEFGPLESDEQVRPLPLKSR